MRFLKTNRRAIAMMFVRLSVPGPPGISVSRLQNFPREVKIFRKIPVIVTTTLNHRVNNILLNYGNYVADLQ